MKHIFKTIALFSLTAFLLVKCKKDDHNPEKGFVLTMSNQAKGNSIIAYHRDEDGTLTFAGAFPTGGLGAGAGLGNQGGLFLSSNHHWLFAVNAGSNNFSVLKLTNTGLELANKSASGGTMPISIANYKNLVYVLNAGGSGNIAGFYLGHAGSLTSIPNSIKPLSSNNSGPAQISFSHDGSALVVTEKGTNRITTYKLNNSGIPVTMHTHNSALPTPFGFAVGRHGNIFVSEANGGAPEQSALTAYRVNDNGIVSLVDGPESTHETAACWVVVTSNGKYAYVTNTGSHTVSGYRISPGGQIELLDSNGITAETGPGSAPIDEALSNNSKFLYTLNSGNNTISGFLVRGDGSLRSISGAGGLPSGANGLVAK